MRKFIELFVSPKGKTPLAICIKEINNGYMIGETYCQNKDAVVGLVTQIVRNELDGMDRYWFTPDNH